MHEHLTHTWNPLYITLSYVIASLASFMSLQLAGRASRLGGSSRNFYLVWQGLLLGFGIWSMHFIGMLAFDLHSPVQYRWGLTLFSGLAAIAFVTPALFIVRSGRLSFLRLLSSGVLAGFGICVMHYTGMAAMQVDARVSYAPLPFSLSVLIAVSAATVALYLFYLVGSHWALEQRASVTGTLKAVAALVMGVAIVGMHYTGMAAVNFTASGTAGVVTSSDTSFLGLMVVASTVIVFVLTGLTLLLDQDDKEQAFNTSAD